LAPEKRPYVSFSFVIFRSGGGWRTAAAGLGRGEEARGSGERTVGRAAGEEADVSREVLPRRTLAEAFVNKIE